MFGLVQDADRLATTSHEGPRLHAWVVNTLRSVHDHSDALPIANNTLSSPAESGFSMFVLFPNASQYVRTRL